MKTTSLFQGVAIAVVTLSQFSTSVSAQDAPVNQSLIVNHMKKYCYECHNPKDKKGDFTLSTLRWTISDDEMAQHWQDVLDAMNSGEMPPEDEPQPTKAEFDQVVAGLTKKLEIARTNLEATGGKYVVRRLNRREYKNTIKSLFGLNIDDSKIPDDIRSEEHFDTASAIQYFDAGLLEYYIRIGKDIANEGFKWSAQPYAKVKTKRHEVENTRGKEIYGGRSHGKTGYYLYHGNRNSDTVGAELGNDPRASYLLKLRGGLVGKNVPEVKHYLVAHGSPNMNSYPDKVHGVLRLHGSEENPGVSEILVPRVTLTGEKSAKVTFEEVSPIGPTNFGRWWPKYLDLVGGIKDEPTVWVDYIEVEGPLYESKQNIFGDLISPSGKNLGGANKARELIEEFAFHAFRRIKPSSSYVDKLETYYKFRVKEGAGHKTAMAETIGVILASPGFLYMEEPVEVNSKTLTGHAFANRLSYFLWSSPPDEELVAVAQDGSIMKPEVLKQQVDRMLSDPKAESFYDGFMSQWAELDRLEQIAVDWLKHPIYNTGVRYSQHREPIEFFKHLVKQNLGVKQMISSDFAVVNHQMAHFYDIERPESPGDFLPVKLGEKSNRGGFLTQSAFLTIGSAGDRTSPVIRGTLIMEKLMNDPPPPPPPNVPELGEASDKPISNRELVEKHRSQRVCASCHDKIDPIGYGLENFGSIGEWRETEKVGEKDVDVEVRAKLHTGERFKNLLEFMTVMQKHEGNLGRNMIESLTGYGIGRPVEFSDVTDLDNVTVKAKADGFKMRDMIFHIVNSKTFKGK